MNNEYNKILDQLMEKISKAVVDEEYDKVIINFSFIRLICI
jgi:hypothetical protein